VNGKGIDREGTLSSFYLDGGYDAPEGRPGGNPMPVGGYPAPEGRPASGGYGTEGRPTGSHSVQLVNREQVTITGVLNVDSFDEEEILLETELGGLTLRGEELQIRQLDLESGKFAVEGYITALIYTAPRQGGRRPTKGRSFLERLLK
jgi:sporulation protein YabP